MCVQLPIELDINQFVKQWNHIQAAHTITIIHVTETASEPAVASTVTTCCFTDHQATNALPPAHLIKPANGESIMTPGDALVLLQDWAFTQGFTVITKSTRKGRNHLQLHPPQYEDTEHSEDDDRRPGAARNSHKGKGL
jgi:hypothetical protein